MRAVDTFELITILAEEVSGFIGERRQVTNGHAFYALLLVSVADEEHLVVIIRDISL